LINWRAFVEQLGRQLGLDGRLVYLDGGNLDTLLLACRGVVTVNSTVGLNALQKGVPVKVLGSAIFDISHLSDQASLDTFWQAPSPPDEALRDAFFRLVAAAIQVRGNFYSKGGTDAGAAAIAGRLDARSLNEPDGFIQSKPRTRPEKRKS
jgi:capsular polysaccharide export protein